MVTRPKLLCLLHEAQIVNYLAYDTALVFSPSAAREYQARHNKSDNEGAYQKPTAYQRRCAIHAKPNK